MKLYCISRKHHFLFWWWYCINSPKFTSRRDLEFWVIELLFLHDTLSIQGKNMWTTIPKFLQREKTLWANHIMCWTNFWPLVIKCNWGFWPDSWTYHTMPPWLKFLQTNFISAEFNYGCQLANYFYYTLPLSSVEILSVPFLLSYTEQDWTC